MSEEVEIPKDLPEEYKKIIGEWAKAEFDTSSVLDGAYGNLELFQASPTLVGLAIKQVMAELEVSATERPQEYIDSRGDFGYTIDVSRFVEHKLRVMRRFFEEE